MMGRPEELPAFFSRVCEVLQCLPADGLEAEKKILAAEAAIRPYNLCGNLFMRQFGAIGHGLRAVRELETDGASIEQMNEWRAQRFTRSNAVFLDLRPRAG